MSDKAKAIGVIGLGLMGEAQSRRLLDAGYAVTGFDIDPAKRDRLGALGGRPVASLGAVAQAVERVLLAVFTTDQVEAVIEGPDGLLAATAGKRPLLVICTSTCEPDRMTALAARVAPQGLEFLELPLSGTSDQVLRGEGVGLIGGSEAAIDGATDILDVICPRRFRVGAVGTGSKTKLAVNLILGLNRAALAEGLAFAEHMGLDGAAFLEVARGSAAYSQVMDTKGEKMLRRDYAPQGKTSQALKDLHMTLERAAGDGQTLPLAEVYVTLLEACVAQGEGEWDSCCVIEEIRRRRTAPSPMQGAALS